MLFAREEDVTDRGKCDAPLSECAQQAYITAYGFCMSRGRETQMTRTTITAHDDRHVTIKFTTLETDQEVQMDIWAPIPSEGGSSYVRYDGNKQLCAGLSSRGSTLTYRHGTKLVDLVRREYRAMRAAEKRDLARYA